MDSLNVMSLACVALLLRRLARIDLYRLSCKVVPRSQIDRQPDTEHRNRFADAPDSVWLDELNAFNDRFNVVVMTQACWSTHSEC